MLFGEGVRLRGAERDDLPLFVRWFNDPDVRQYLAMFAPMSMVQEEQWFDDIQAAADMFFFVIERQEGDAWQPIGTTALARLDWRNRVAEFGISIGEKALWGRGYGTEAARVLLRFGFLELNLHRIQMDVFAFNQRAIRSYQKLGFTLEGTRRQALFHDGRYHDVHLMGMLRDEFSAGAEA